MEKLSAICMYVYYFRAICMYVYYLKKKNRTYVYI